MTELSDVETNKSTESAELASTLVAYERKTAESSDVGEKRRYSELIKLEDEVISYRESLKIIKEKGLSSSKIEVLDLLLSRDKVAEELNSKELANPKKISPRLFEIDAEVTELDEELKKLGVTIAIIGHLDKWRERFQCNENAWWWFFQEPEKIDPWDRLDWLWDALTLGLLALSASFMVSIFQAISVGDMTIIATFSTIAQLGGLAVVSQGALTENGKAKVQQFLYQFNIPSKFHSEVMLILAAILFTAVYMSHKTLHAYYLEQGDELYKEGLLGDAEVTLRRGLQIDPDNADFNTQLGKIYESLGDLSKAIEQYSIGANSGNILSINNLGRVYINNPDPTTGDDAYGLAESFLLLGLQRAEMTHSDNKDLLYQLNRNVGWALLMQEKYETAEKFLLKAIAFDREIKEKQTGGGMAYCFLAQIYTTQEKKEKAEPFWSDCIEYARPETIHEYKWLLDVKQDEFAYCIDTSRVVAGIEYERPTKTVEECKEKFTPSGLTK
jgi:tetratricopeptide (TPR) repeat protein